MKNNEENNKEIIKLKIMSIIIDSRKNLNKLIDSPDRRIYRYSNFSNYRNSKKSNKYV